MPHSPIHAVIGPSASTITPARESGNYVPTNLLERDDAFFHLDETHALHPIKLHGERGMVPDLYPWSL